LEQGDINPGISLSVSPNPLSEVLNVSCYLSEEGYLRLSILDVSGREAEILYQGSLGSGEHSLSYTLGNDLPEGCYIVQLQMGNGIYSERFLLLR